MEGMTLGNMRNQQSKGYKKAGILVFFCGLLLLMASCSAGASLNPKIAILEKRIFELEQDKIRTRNELNSEVDALKERVTNELTNIRQSQRFFLEELNQIKEDMALTTDEVEKTAFQTRKQRNRLDNLVKRVGDQVIALDELKTFFENDTTLAAQSNSEEKTEFKAAFQFYKSKQFGLALTELNRFRLKFPSSELSDDALFTIAYIYFLKGNYEEASVRLFELTRQFPNSNQINEAKWWLGVSLERTNDIDGAMELYQNLMALPAQNPIRVRAEFRMEELSEDSH